MHDCRIFRESQLCRELERHLSSTCCSLLEVLATLCPFELLPSLAVVLSSRLLSYNELTFSWGCQYKGIWNILCQHKPWTHLVFGSKNIIIFGQRCLKIIFLCKIQMQLCFCKEHYELQLSRYVMTHSSQKSSYQVSKVLFVATISLFTLNISCIYIKQQKLHVLQSGLILLHILIFKQITHL